MIHWTEDIKFLLLLIPISTHTSKSSGTIIQRVGSDANMGFRIGYDLTFEVRNGIVRHSKGRNEILPNNSKELALTLEGQIVRLADIIAYVNHDMDDALQVSRQIARVTVEHENYVILLYHRPRGLRAAADSGVDLMLSGHTHNGQIVPFNLIVARVFKKTQGLYQRGKTSLYVSTGTGTWGPIMRIGTRSEITLFEIIPA